MVWALGARTVIDRINLGLDGLFAAGVAPVDGPDAIVWLREVEVLRRQVDAAATALVGAIDRAGLYVDDGHVGHGDGQASRQAVRGGGIGT